MYCCPNITCSHRCVPRRRRPPSSLLQAKRNFQVGTATITDTYDAQARFDLVNAQEITGVNDIEVKREPYSRSSVAAGPLPAPT